MTGAATIVVEVHAVLNRRRDEIEHALPLMVQGVAVIRHGFADAKVDAEAGAEPLHARGHTTVVEQPLQPGVESLTQGRDVLVEAGLLVCLDCRERGGDTDYVAVVGATVLAIALGHEVVHDVAPSAEGADRHATAQGLAERAQVWLHTQVLLSAADTHAEAAEHFVEDQEHTVPPRLVLQATDKLARRHHATGVVIDGLANDGSQFAAMTRQRRLQQIRTIERDDDEILFDLRSDP